MRTRDGHEMRKSRCLERLLKLGTGIERSVSEQDPGKQARCITFNRGNAREGVVAKRGHESAPSPGEYPSSSTCDARSMPAKPLAMVPSAAIVKFGR